MKIAVCVKQVPDATSVRRIDAATNRLDRSGEGALNATDVNAVEEALRIKEAQGGEVVVVSLGPAKAVDSLRKALAMGADRAVLVSDDAAAGSDLVATSYVLAKALERESADLVLFGQQSSRLRRRRALGRRRRPAAAPARSPRSPSSASRARPLTGKRQTEFGYDVIAAPLPAVVAVSDAINEPRYPSLKGIMGAKSKPTETLSLAEIGAEAERAGARRLADDGDRAGAASVEGRSDQDRGRRLGRRAARRLARGEEAAVTHTRLPRAPRRRDPEGRARRAREGARTRRRRRGRRRRPRCRRRRGLGRRVRRLRPSTSSTRPRSRPRCRSRGSTRSRRSSRPRAPRTSSSPPRCSPRTSRPGSRRGSTRA